MSSALAPPAAASTIERPAAATRRPLAVRAPAAALAGTALATAIGACTWLVLAASQRPSVLSPPTIKQPMDGWLLGPLHGLLSGLSSDRVRLRGDFTIALGVLFVAWLVAWMAAPALPTKVVAGAVGLAQLVFLLGPPLSLTDTFNYIVYGRMALHGQNPYVVIPQLAAHDHAWLLSNWHHLPSPYGPLFTLLCEPLGALSTPAAFWAWKAVAVGSALGALALVWWLARRLGRSPQRALACAGLCPVTLAVGLGGFHNDGLGMLAVLGAVALLLVGRDARTAAAAGRADAAAAALVVVAAGLKPSFAVVVPLVVIGARRRTWAIGGAAVAGAVVGLVVLVGFGGALPAVGLQGRITTPLSLPSLLGVAAGHGGADAAVRSIGRDALFVVVALASLVVLWRRRWVLQATGLVLLAANLSLAWVMPWYLGWWLPFAALALPRLLAPLAVVACLWLGVGGLPQLPQVIHAVGYYPTRTATGLANHNLEVRLVR